ncbi:hypothetical protein [Chenggangzhangella methanolivorans]|uniref:Uncharacterized protein n=1 Tax=Chenggangzhangella methanolivorans TaxID=1437009 RepID=A0A9E6RE86_9HYPH|nr:hypothetical protein [Chenggangzhangella methanolivorans]QZO01809.1 hypothetical protein K6K41_10865 [Chenggangzhangella methanolivorans]
MGARADGRGPRRSGGGCPGSGRDGFLLVEALSALAISALLIAALLAFTGMLRRSADRTAFRVETMEVAGRTVWTVASELRQTSRQRWAPEERTAGGATPTRAAAQPGGASPNARPRPGSNEEDDGGPQTGGRSNADPRQSPDGEQQAAEKEPDRNFVFSGTPERVLFALTPELATGLRAPVLVVYQVDASGAVLRAEGAIGPEAKGPDAVRLGPVARVAPGPERIRFAYVDKDQNGEEVILDAWTDRRRMPAAVRIDRSDIATGRPLGSLRVPILLSGEPGCADPEKRFCSRVDRDQSGGAGGATQPGRPAAGRQGSDGEPM